jgi:chromosome segregation protein
MHLCRLRLIGFKSFVDATELAIEPGLTGIVGPNGCGKSNLAEALRWVMGESSARRLRGGDMDDVIFAGTALRPARNIAEVALTLDTSNRDAANAAFNDCEEIEVVRRIERGCGSTYRINGREVRARDVQLLFADAASGAHSGAMVSQGRISALIEAKPSEKRMLLEEAAGTAGLHARRRETELKLDAAEENLARLDDVIATIEAQFETLKKQARQAQRYRRLSAQIRQSEALLFIARWLAAETEAERAFSELRLAERAVAEASECARDEGRARETAEAELPPLRLAEAAAAAELQRLTHARSGLEEELQRVLAGRGEGEERMAQLAADLKREEADLTEAAASVERLSQERLTLVHAEAEQRSTRALAETHLREATARRARAETVLQQQTEAAAAADARRTTLKRDQSELTERRSRLEAQRRQAEHQHASLAAALLAPEAIATAAAATAEAERQVALWRAQVERSEEEIADRLAREQAALDAAREVETRLTRLEAEAEGLKTLLRPAADLSTEPPALAMLRVAAGFEAAIGAAFGDELAAPLAETSSAAPRSWCDLGEIANGASLPAGARPLGEVVSAPSALARSLAQAGWVENDEMGQRLQPCLAPGQRLVDREGRLWRWDGFTVTRPGSSTATEHLRQRHRLAELDAEIAALATARMGAAQRAATAQAKRREANEADRAARRQLRDAEAALAQARADETEFARRQVDTETRLAAAFEMLDKLHIDLAETEAQAEQTRRDLSTLPEPGQTRAVLDKARIAAAEARRDEAEARAAIERLSQEANTRRARLAAIDREEQAWQRRHESAAAQRMLLLQRQVGLAVEIARLAARPAEIAADSEALAAAITGAAAECRRLADALALAEAQLRDAAERSRRADQAVAEARQRLARAEVVRDGTAAAVVGLSREIRERLDAAPEALPELAGLAVGAHPPDPSETAARLDRLLRERDGMGPVNLMAETEAAEIESRISTLKRERTDLTAAITRLRGGVAALDEEVRRRMAAAFERINGHFAALFARLFGGGKAYLSLVDNADPLAAGLEIMASPPGKKPQSLSLLSGGEQALTALALVFAVFLTNPAPVCVLDEADAALDDANVDRLCTLVKEIADSAGTRFLIITHHRITMARVDRLFGVTMTERGVSRLVSVDLARAARLRQTA